LGGAGDDEITGDANDNLLNGGRGNDTLAGGPGDDTLIANYFHAGHDEQDFVLAETGNDIIYVVDDQPDVNLGGNLTSGLKLQAGLDYIQAAITVGHKIDPALEVMDPTPPAEAASLNAIAAE